MVYASKKLFSNVRIFARDGHIVANPREQTMKEPFKGEPENYEKRKQQPDWEEKLESYGRYSGDDDLAVEPARIAMDRRLVAFIIDVAAGWIIGLFINFIPFISVFIQAQTAMIFYLIVKDGFFDGRGIGKNLMGLQVVDIKSGEGANIGQSIKRNMVVFGPALLLYFVSSLLKVVPNDIVNNLVMRSVDIACGIYTIVAIPYEAYRAYSRPDGQRWGDHFAGCTIIEAPMDFSNFLRR